MNEVKNIIDWKKLLKDAASGDATLQYEVGNYFDHGLEINHQTVVEQNPSEAFKWYEKAYSNGHIEAGTRLADFYSEGKFCSKNITLAKKLYNKGIENGSSIAAHNLAVLYCDLGDFSMSFELYKTAQKLDKTNLIELAYCYYFGIGTDKDKKKALEIFQKIAGDTSENRNCAFEIEDANYFIGLYFLEGVIVEKSIENARMCFERANIDNDHRSANEMLLMIGKPREINLG
ncbi:MAG: tetratricopeptide repeat protein [Chitinophagales bacterium]|nr:sel1 repeat family protein [Bacteroidota bacterium]